MNVFLRVLEAPGSPLPERISVLEALRIVCTNGQVLVDIYLNFDCDLHQDNIFQRSAWNSQHRPGLCTPQQAPALHLPVTFPLFTLVSTTPSPSPSASSRGCVRVACL